VAPETAAGGVTEGVGAEAGGAGAAPPLGRTGGAETEGVCTVVAFDRLGAVERRTAFREWVEAAARPAKAATSAVAIASAPVLARRTRAIAASRSTAARRRRSGDGSEAGFIHVEADQTQMRRR
jgi:hypothetical protein